MIYLIITAKLLFCLFSYSKDSIVSDFLQMGFFAEAGPVQIFVSNHVSWPLFLLWLSMQNVDKAMFHLCCFS